MKRISTTNRSQNLFGAGKDGFRNGDLGAGLQATEFDAAWCNAIQEELSTIVEAAGLAVNPASYTQVLESIQRLIDAQSGNYALDTGAANAYVVAINPAITVYTDGMTVRVKAVNTNTGASTLNAGGGAVGLRNDVGAALVAGDVPAGGVFTAVYISSANQFYITGLVPSQAMSQLAADARYAPIIKGKPTGEIFEFAGTAAPAGSLVCPVAQTNLSRTTYAALFAAIGTTWGAGDGSTTFGIPWFPADHVSVQGNNNVGTQTAGVVISHSHSFSGTVTGSYASGGVTALSYSASNGVGAITFPVTGSVGTTGGTGNLAAGVRVLKCVQYQ